MQEYQILNKDKISIADFIFLKAYFISCIWNAQREGEEERECVFLPTVSLPTYVHQLGQSQDREIQPRSSTWLQRPNYSSHTGGAITGSLNRMQSRVLKPGLWCGMQVFQAAA